MATKKTAVSKSKGQLAKTPAKKTAEKPRKQAGIKQAKEAPKTTVKKTESEAKAKAGSKKSVAKSSAATVKSATRKVAAKKTGEDKGKKAEAKTVAQSKPTVKAKPAVRSSKLAPWTGGDRSKRPVRTRKTSVKKLTPKDLEYFETQLLILRERIMQEITFLSDDNLRRSSNEPDRDDNSRYGGDPADQGAANFDREFALSLLSSEQDVLYEIDEALRRIEEGTYGVCEHSGEPIERVRLEAIPYARYSVRSQEEMERGRTRLRQAGQSNGGLTERKSAYAELMDQDDMD